MSLLIQSHPLHFFVFIFRNFFCHKFLGLSFIFFMNPSTINIDFLESYFAGICPSFRDSSSLFCFRVFPWVFRIWGGMSDSSSSSLSIVFNGTSSFDSDSSPPFSAIVYTSSFPIFRGMVSTFDFDSSLGGVIYFFSYSFFFDFGTFFFDTFFLGGVEVIYLNSTSPLFQRWSFYFYS